jgi:hypothetical protein
VVRNRAVETPSDELYSEGTWWWWTTTTAIRGRYVERRRIRPSTADARKVCSNVEDDAE